MIPRARYLIYASWPVLLQISDFETAMNVRTLHPVSIPADDTTPVTSGDFEHANPFDSNRDSRYFYPSPSHKEALGRLRYLAEDGNFALGMLSGTIGSGKSLIRTIFHARLDKSRFISVIIENSLLDLDGLLLEIISQMRGERYQSVDVPDRYSKLSEFKRLLHDDVVRHDRHLIISIDEAQMLDRATLEGLRSLTNINSSQQNLMTILLIGQPELVSVVKGLPQLDQRIGLRFFIGNLNQEKTVAYINHRIKVSQLQQKTCISENMFHQLYRVTQGNPRMINGLLKLALEHARGNEKPLDDISLSAVINDRHMPYCETINKKGLIL